LSIGLEVGIWRNLRRIRPQKAHQLLVGHLDPAPGGLLHEQGAHQLIPGCSRICATCWSVFVGRFGLPVLWARLTAWL
jgi:hypothetical protein